MLHVKPIKLDSVDMLEHLREAMNPLEPKLGHQVIVRDIIRKNLRPLIIVWDVQMLVHHALKERST